MAYYNITIEAKERKLFKGKEKEGSIFRLKEKLSRGFEIFISKNTGKKQNIDVFLKEYLLT